jgi:mannosyl-oligosaccharide alpha-1,2-mannosidase
VFDVDDVRTRKDDKMETFWLVRLFVLELALVMFSHALQSETLKYLFLLFSDESAIPLNGKKLDIQSKNSLIESSFRIRL